MPKVIDDENVFRAAIEILVQQGYENATTKAIAAAADVHEATLFRKYGSKFDLIHQAIQHQLTDTPLNHLRYTGALQADLLAILEAYVETSKLHGEIMPLLFVEVARDPSLQPFLDRPLNNIRLILDIIEAYQTQGLLKQEASQITLYSLIGPIMLCNMAQRASTDAAQFELDLQQHLETFLFGRSQ